MFVPDKETEEQYIRRVQDGDMDAFSSLMDLHVRRLRAFVAMKVTAGHLVDEVAHEAFVYAYQHIHDFQSGDFGAWLRAIAFNVLRAELKKNARRTVREEKYADEELIDMEVAEAEAPPEAAPELPHLKACMGLLTRRIQEMVLLRYQKSMTAEAIARQLGQKANAVRTALCRARQQLRDCLLQRAQMENVSHG